MFVSNHVPIQHQEKRETSGETRRKERFLGKGIWIRDIGLVFPYI